ncbi:HD-GYP domain-containing protein [Caldisalinibacter kiritimatiensis]|uniref:Metal dependent phosphohydrolase n=1 Tax=Caldisalinibacter kiritimatiensis TaxID=1304284 RepID=R1AW41_9FIRM|nr:HD-GYP domain-containing protein [Caldisalinibacter kiritimatiensis]EOD00857.1 metal dependent phosphohydrolase [Caldisalinibacter kiritimatiensis]
MRLVSTEELKEGMTIAKTVYTANGTTIINEGIKLKKSYIEKLKKLGISKVYVKDIHIKLEVKDVIKEETRRESLILVKNIMDDLRFSEDIPIDEVKSKVSEIIEQLMENDEILINLSEIRSIDDYTFGHSVNVCVLSLITGISMGYTKNELLDLGIGAMLHDIGKVKVPSKILNKPSKLTQDEYEEIKNHTIYGYKLLSKVEGISELSRKIVLSHHERVDGKGYPYGLKNEDIHPFSKIVSVADVYDALTTDRVYKRRIKVHEAVEYMISMSDHQFDYNIVKKFLSNIAIFPLGAAVELSTNQIGYIVDNRKEFPTRPVVEVVASNNGKKITIPYKIDLLKNTSVVIVNTIDDI